MGGEEPGEDPNTRNDNLMAIEGEVKWPPLFLFVTS